MSAPRAWVMVQFVGCEVAEPVEHGDGVLAGVAVRHPVDLTGGAGPVAELCVRIVRIGADDRDRAGCAGSGGAAVGAGGQPAVRAAGCRRCAAAPGIGGPSPG